MVGVGPPQEEVQGGGQKEPKISTPLLSFYAISRKVCGFAKSLGEPQKTTTGRCLIIVRRFQELGWASIQTVKWPPKVMQYMHTPHTHTHARTYHMRASSYSNEMKLVRQLGEGEQLENEEWGLSTGCLGIGAWRSDWGPPAMPQVSRQPCCWKP